MVQESFKALKNTNINPLITSYKTAPSNVGSFFIPTLCQRCEVRATRAVMGCRPHRQKTLSKPINVIINYF